MAEWQNSIHFDQFDSFPRFKPDPVKPSVIRKRKTILSLKILCIACLSAHGYKGFFTNGKI
jgi:hypothetical protein